MALLLGALLLAPTAHATEDLVLTLHAETSVVLVGEGVLVHAQVADAAGAPREGVAVTLDAQRAATNAEGRAVFLVERASEGAVTLEATAPGAPSAAIDVAFLAPRLALDVPSTSPLDAPALVAAVLQWGANRTPVVGAELGLAAGDALVATATTDELGRVAFTLPAPEAVGLASYALVADDPLWSGLGAAATLVWITPPLPDPTPPTPTPTPPTTPDVDAVPPASAAPPAPPANQPPILGGVAIRLEGLAAVPYVGTLADPDGDPVFLAFTWNVDGDTSSGPRADVHRGASVTLTVLAVDSRGGISRATSTAVVPPNLPPVARASVEGARYAGTELVFDALASEDPEGAPLTFAWTFSDGTRLDGARVTRAFPAGELRATLVATDAEGASATTDVALVLASAPATAPPQVPVAGDAPLVLPPDTSLERVVTDGPSGRVLLATSEGLRLWTPATAEMEPVRDLAVAPSAVRYETRAVLTEVEAADAPGGTWSLLRLRDPQPLLPLLGAFDADGEAQAWWRDGSDVLVLTREPRAHLEHSLAPLSLDARLEETSTSFRIVASVAGGAPLRSFRVEGPEGVVLDVTERALEARVAPGTEARTYRVIAETLGGERIERELVVAAQEDEVPLKPAGGAPDEVAGARAGAVPAGLWPVALALALAALVVGRHRRR